MKMVVLVSDKERKIKVTRFIISNKTTYVTKRNSLYLE